MISAAPDVSMDLASTDSTLIDFDYLARQTFSDRMLECDLLELFVRQCGALLPVIAGPNPVDARLFAAHTLKGSARAVGAWGLAMLVERAEALLQSGDADGVANLMIELAPVAKAAQAAAARGRASG
jgi:HPt (histidine-containing phosphotransfer) domain-containing protein